MSEQSVLNAHLTPISAEVNEVPDGNRIQSNCSQ